MGIAPDRAVINHLVEGDGTLRADDLAHAVAVASEANPGARLVLRDKRWVDSGKAPEVRALTAESFDRKRLDSPALRIGLTDPTCEVLLVLGDPTTVVFRAAHAVMDGRGLLMWASDVFRVLRGEQPLGADSPLNNDDLLRRVCTPDDPPPRAEDPAMEFPSPLGPRPHPAAGPLWRRRSVDGTHPAASAKVTAALVAAYGPGRYFVPVDLRRHAPDVRSTASLSHPLHLSVGADDGWEEVQHKMLTAMADREELANRANPGIMDLPLPVLRAGIAELDDNAARTDTHTGRAYVSHLGAVSLDDFSTDGFHATSLYTLGGVNPGSPPEINLVEMAGRTEITVAWYDGPEVAARAEALLDVAQEALSPRERREWVGNRTERALPSAHSVVRLFRQQVERTPERIALSGPEGEVSYAELSRRADAVAGALRRHGVGRGAVVGLLAGRSVAAVAAVWGVLRAGACYLPLDVRHPDLRLSELLTDAGSTFCLVERPYDVRDCVPEGCRALLLDDLVEAEPDGGVDAEIGCGDLAYIIYTSGSTGRPKGVQVEHGNLANYVHWATRVFEVDEGIRLPLLTSPSFDVSGTSVFLPLLAGGQVILMREDPNHLSLRRLLEFSGANALNLTPSHLDLIGRLDIAPKGFRTVIVIGEQLRVEVAARAQEMFGPECRIVNEYGPTEATIGCTAHTFDPVADGDGAVVPIGVPADNTTVHLLDAQGRFVAPGEVGEMYLGGAQLARGYLGRPDLNRERFPVLADGTRVYRTGDLARVLPSGALEFIGRVDDQVKVRGHRVEPAEVAQVLEGHPAVDRAVVVAKSRPGQSGKALYGYVLANREVAEEELEQHLAERLPGYMVPAATMVLSQLPYTVSGKVDVRALPDPLGDQPRAQADPAGPVNDPVQDAVARIWAEILGVPPSRLHALADFHRLGGDSVSLLAMLAALGREVLTPDAEAALMARLPEILREPTLERVTALVRQAGSELAA
ncbi:amino acid adenylation domain-containing protein [Streptantibioticus rubrisoli]|uniref:Non-ribosomal peptide synthetase n=1 Tax=Streptantibioticus rubrisoli TaxID=1387313 RepID=A0ABT1P769_9ACTN|nr:non-ribosomal peptide synthetase [Streptantibioticus rubrisoli]MCQ4041224.1 non-ribosomal peptide synthetase [Streptantibioticus rubrisoli]